MKIYLNCGRLIVADKVGRRAVKPKVVSKKKMQKSFVVLYGASNPTTHVLYMFRENLMVKEFALNFYKTESIIRTMKKQLIRATSTLSEEEIKDVSNNKVSLYKGGGSFSSNDLDMMRRRRHQWIRGSIFLATNPYPRHPARHFRLVR
ncbi:hypothetical protein ACFE04_022847 [Oxalis oulophora]